MEFSQFIADKICEALEEGESLKKLSEDDSFPSRPTIYKWLRENAGFANNYARAREVQQDTYYDEIVHIAETEPDVAKARLMIDARRWHAAKLAPKKYGEKLDVNTTIGLSDPLQSLLETVANNGTKLVKVIDHDSNG